MQELARDEEMMARSKQVIKDLKYRFIDKSNGAARLASLLRRHFDVYVDEQIIEDIWQAMPDKAGTITTQSSKGSALRH